MTDNENLVKVSDKSAEDVTPDQYDDPKERLLAQPMPTTFLYESESRRVLIEFFVECFENGNHTEFSKSHLMRETGVARNTLFRHLPILVDFGIIKEVGTESRPRYKVSQDPEENEMLRSIIDYNQYVSEQIDMESLEKHLREE